MAGRGPFVVTSSPDFIAAARDFYATWTAAETGGQQQHAKQRSTVFSIMQYREHVDTGVPLWTREQWDGLIATLDEAGVLDRHAAIWHDKDTFSARESQRQQEKGRAVTEGDLKPLHFHGVVRLLAGERKQVRFLAERADLPASRVRTPRDSYAEGEVITGPLAADVAFFDFCEYLVHENETARAEGKHQYPRDEVFANFDFAEFLDAGRPAKAKGRGKARLSDVDRLAMRIREEGLTLDEADAADPLAYNKGETRMKRARAQYLASLPQPQYRINFYLHGEGGTGKDALARALSRTLVPGDWVPGEREPFFVVGADNVEFEGYDGEPVVIFEEATAASLVGQLGRRNVFRYLSPFPSKTKMNVKNASTLPVNTITIITGPDDYGTFLDGLAGQYVGKDGVRHKAENKPQAYRRFPVIIPVRSDSFSVLVNKGFLDGTDAFMEYYAYENFRQNMRQVLRRVKGIEPVERRVETRLTIEARQVAPIKEHYEAIVSAVSSPPGSEDPDALLAEFADLGTPISETELAATHEQRMVEKLCATQGCDRSEVIEHFRRYHLAGVDTPDGSAFIYRNGRAYWCSEGHIYMELQPVNVAD